MGYSFIKVFFSLKIYYDLNSKSFHVNELFQSDSIGRDRNLKVLCTFLLTTSIGRIFKWTSHRTIGDKPILNSLNSFIMKQREYGKIIWSYISILYIMYIYLNIILEFYKIYFITINIQCTFVPKIIEIYFSQINSYLFQCLIL